MSAVIFNVGPQQRGTGRFGVVMPIMLGLDMEPEKLARTRRHQPASERETGKQP